MTVLGSVTNTCFTVVVVLVVVVLVVVEVVVVVVVVVVVIVVVVDVVVVVVVLMSVSYKFTVGPGIVCVWSISGIVLRLISRTMSIIYVVSGS